MQSDNSGIIGKDKAERNFGEQPISKIMAEHNLRAHDLVAESPEQLTHKMVSRGRKGRKLTINGKMKLLKAVNRRTGKNYTLEELFNY